MSADLDDGHGLTTALRDRMEDVRPDLDRLVAVATRQGTRIRRRTRIASFGSALGVAAVAVAVGASWTGTGSSGAREQQLGFGDEPSASASSSPAAPSPSPTATAPSAPQTHGPPKGERSPVTLELPGWTCTPPADEKFICSSGGRSVQITWRPGDERHYWGKDPDKSADFISDVHGEFFVTVVVGQGTPISAAVAVGQALIWADSASG